MTEIYKNINQTAPPIMPSLFEIRRNSHSTRHFLWANLPPEYKFANSLNFSKRKIKLERRKLSVLVMQNLR